MIPCLLECLNEFPHVACLCILCAPNIKVLPQYPKLRTAPPSPWRQRVRCTSGGSRGPTAALQSQPSGWSTGAAAAPSGSWPRTTSRLSNCWWKFKIWIPVSISFYFFYLVRMIYTKRFPNVCLHAPRRVSVQVSSHGCELVRGQPSQHPLQAVPGATGQSHGRPPGGRTSHLLDGRHQRHADHAALDCESHLLFSTSVS